MHVRVENKGQTLYLVVSGEIDEHNVSRSRIAIDKLADEQVGRIDSAVFDLGGVSFMDSTGIGFLIGRYKKFFKYGIPMYVTNLSSSTEKVLQMSGIFTIIPKV